MWYDKSSNTKCVANELKGLDIMATNINRNISSFEIKYVDNGAEKVFTGTGTVDSMSDAVVLLAKNDIVNVKVVSFNTVVNPYTMSTADYIKYAKITKTVNLSDLKKKDKTSEASVSESTK